MQNRICVIAEQNEQLKISFQCSSKSRERGRLEVRSYEGRLWKLVFICCGVETSLLRAGGDQIESELAERELKKTMEMSTRRLAECVNPGSEKLRFVLVAV